MAKKKHYYQRPDGLFEVSRRINGKRVVFRGKTEREVDKQILEYNVQEAEKKNGRKFPEVADEWERRKENEVREATRRTYSFAVKRLKDAFPGYIEEIRPLDIMRHVQSMADKDYSGETVGIELTVCKQIFSYAVLAGDIDISPATEVKKPSGLPEKKREALTEEQEAIVRQAGKERAAPFWLFPYLLLYTGLRRGEALALTYGDIDRKAGVIHINKKLAYYGEGTPTLDNFLKSKNGLRDVPLLQPLADVLPKGRVGLIFPGDDGGFMSGPQLKKHWREYCRAVGFVDKKMITKIVRKKQVEVEVEEFPITPHCFRHSFATICYESGLDARQAARILGDTAITVDGVYTHLREKHEQAASEKLEKYCVTSV